MEVSRLEAEYNLRIIIAEDIHEHLPVIRSHADLCRHVTEFGVRYGSSTLALLCSAAEHVRSYDPIRTSDVDWIERQCKAEGKDWKFIQGSSLKETIEETDLLMIDSVHAYDHTIQELTLHSSRVGKYIILHDTALFGEQGQYETFEGGKHKVWIGPNGTGLNRAISEFLSVSPLWRIKVVYTNNNGLTILERKQL